MKQLKKSRTRIRYKITHAHFIFQHDMQLSITSTDYEYSWCLCLNATERKQEAFHLNTIGAGKLHVSSSPAPNPLIQVIFTARNRPTVFGGGATPSKTTHFDYYRFEKKKNSKKALSTGSFLPAHLRLVTFSFMFVSVATRMHIGCEKIGNVQNVRRRNRANGSELFMKSVPES